MPMRPITVKANFQLDTSAARAQLQGLQRELNSVTKGATMDLGITSQITQAVREAQQLKQILREATDFSTGAFDLSKFDAAIKQQGKSIAEFKQSLQTLGPEGEKAFNSLATTIASAQVPLKRTSQGVQDLMTAFGNTMRWQATSMAMHKIVGTFQQAFNYAQNLDKSLTNIQIVTGHNADYMRNFAKEANKAAQALSASTLEYTNASLIYYQQGLGDKEVAKRAETTLKLAKVTGESASKVSQQMTAVWNNFSNGVDNLERYADVMTALGATTASSSSEIAKGLEKFASVTKTIGLSYDYAASALATVTAQTRQSADSVGTAFKTLFSRLESLNLGETLDDSTTLNKYSEALLKVGVNVMDVNGNLKNMDNILDELGEKWTSLNKAQQVALAQTVGGVRNYTSLITLMDNWEDFQNNVVTSQLAEGTLQAQADIYAKSWEAAQQRVKTASQGIYDTLISSDFFKGFNNILAGSLNLLGDIGKSLGTGGSLAGISSLILGLRGDAISKSIDNTVNNVLGQTSFGQNIFKQQQVDLLAKVEKEVLDTGSTSAQQRAATLGSIKEAWAKFNPNDRQLFPTKADAQAQRDLLAMRTEQGLAYMNAVVDKDQLDIQKNMGVSNFINTMAGKYNFGGKNTSTINPLLSAIFNGTEYNGLQYKAGLESFMTETYSQNLTKLLSMDPASKGAEILAKQLAAQADNAINGNGLLAQYIKDSPELQDAFSLLSGGLFKTEQDSKGNPVEKIDIDKLKTISGFFNLFQTNNQASLGLLQEELDRNFIQLNPSAGKIENGKVVLNSDAMSKKAYEDYQQQYKTAYDLAVKAGKLGFQNEQRGSDINDKRINLEPKAPKGGEPIGLGASVVATGQMLNSVAMASSSIWNFGKSVKDGTATFSGLTATLGSTGMAVGQISKILHDTTPILKEGGMTVAQLGKIGLAAAAVGGAAILANKIYQANNISGQTAQANESKIAATAQAKEDKQRYDAFQEVITTQNENYRKIYNLQQGTAAYTSQLITANQQAREIIETYNLKPTEDYAIDENSGAISFSAEQVKNINERLLDISKDSDNRAQLATSAYTQLSLEKRDRQLVSQYESLVNPESYAYIDPKKQAERLKEIKDERDIIQKEKEADYQAAIASVLGTSSNLSDAQRLAANILTSNATDNLAGYENIINDLRGDTNTIFGGYKSVDKLRELYYEEFGEYAAEDMDQASLAAAIKSKTIQNKIVELIDQTITDNHLENADLSGYTNFTALAVDDLNKLIQQNQEIITNDKGEKINPYDSLNSLALTKIASSQDSLSQALLNNTNLQNMNFATLADQMQNQLHLSIEQTESLANYINNFGTNFGDATGEAVLAALTGWNGTTVQSWNSEFYKELQNISTSSSIAGLADIEQRIGLVGNRDIVDSMRALQKAMIADINDRGGLAKTLFESSDFQNTFEKLQEVFQTTGNITAQNIADLAAKNETLNGYLQATANQAPMSGTQAVADLANLLASGAITTSEITPALIAFIEEASGTGKGSQQEAVEDAEDFRKSLSDSITDADKVYQEGGKLWYNAIKHDALNDAPLQEWFQQFLTPEDFASIQRILELGTNYDTTWMVNQIKTQLTPVYDMMTELQGGTSKKKAGKGGGGLDTYLAYLGDRDVLGEAGIAIDDNGKITFPGLGEVTFEDLYKQAIESLGGNGEDITENGMYDFLNKQLLNKNYSASQASMIATQIVGRMSSSSLGTVFARNGILAGEKDMLEALRDGKTGITGSALNALFDQYAAGFAGLKIENGELTALTDEELESGAIGVNRDDYRKYIAQKIAEQGGALIDASTLGLLQTIDTASVGNELKRMSEGTIAGSGANAIVDAAIKYGVTRYNVRGDRGQEDLGQAFDFNELQEFYTNILGLTTEDFQRHLPELMKSLVQNTGGDNRAEGRGGLNYQYKDIFGNVHNLSSTDSKYWTEGQFNVDTYMEDVKTEQDKESFNEMYQQKMMQDAIDEAYEHNKNLPQGSKDLWDPYQLYQEKLAAYQQLSEISTQEIIGNDTSIAENERLTQIENLKQQRDLQLQRGNPDEAAEIQKQIDELEANNNEPSTSESTETTSTSSGLTNWDKATDAEKAGFVYSNRADAADIYNYWKQHPGMTQAEAYDDVVVLGKKPEPSTNEGTTPANEETTPEENLPESGPLEGEGLTAAQEEAIAEQEVQAAALAAYEEEKAIEETNFAPPLSAAITNPNAPLAGVVSTFENLFTAKEKSDEQTAKEEADRLAAEQAAAEQAKAQEEQNAAMAAYEAEQQAKEEAARQAAAQAYQDEQDALLTAANESAESWIQSDKSGDLQRMYNSLAEWSNPTQFKEWYDKNFGTETQGPEEEVDQTEVKTQAEAITQAMQQTAFSTFSTNLENNRLYDVSGVSGYNVADITAEEQDTLKRLQAEADSYADMGDKERREAGLSKDELIQRQENAQEAADLYKYQNMMSPEQRMAEINKAIDIYDNGQGADKLTPFQKFLMNSIGEIVDYQGIMADATETDEEGKAKAKKAQVNEEGELVDEEGNPIEMPEGQQPTGGSTGGRESGDAGTNGRPGGGPGNSGLGPGAAPGSHVDTWEKGGHKGGIFRGSDGLDYNFTYNRNGDPVVDRDENGTPIQADTENNKFANLLASGQNNARLLAYASGKEGHIAVTGELGPELRVKSDGSMDILGKTGREYAWVEPDDRIYTASQSAGILKSNKIPGLEGLAKGINNFIPGYGVGLTGKSTDQSSSGSGGGGSSGGGGRSSSGAAAPTEKDSRYDPNTLKIRDILERYYTILQKIDDITRAVEKFSKVADRAWGQDRIKAIEKQTALYQQQYDAQKKYVQEIGEYMNTDSAALTTMIREFVDSYNEGKEEADKLTWAGAQFDSNGVLTNYRDFVEKLVEQYNANAEANAQSKEAQYKFQEQLKDIQMYTDTLNLWESETDKLQELANQILDNSLKEITYRVEYELELNADQKRLLDFQDSFVKDDIFRVAEHIANMNEEIANTAEALEKTRQGLYDYLGTLAGENMRVGEFYDDVALGLATRDEKGIVDAKSYEDIDFTEVSNNLDKWLAELREKDEESAEEVDKIIKRNEEDLIINYRDTLNKINEMNKKLSDNSISLLLTNVQSFFDQISDLSNNPQWTGLSTEQKDYITNQMDAIIQYIQSMGDQFKEIIESMGDSIKAFGKKMDAEIDEFDYYGDVYKSFGNIIDLTNQHMTDITSDFFKTLNNKALDNNINKIETTRRRYELFAGTLQKVQGEYDKMVTLRDQANGPEERAFYQSRVDELKEQLDIANSTMESAHKEFLQSWEDALSKIQENYKSAVEQASKDFEKSFSPLFNTLALLQAQFDREKALGDLYVDNYQRIHDLNKLDRDIQNSIDDTDNLRGKQRLRDLQEEINQLQEDGNDLSEYDLDILDKKYKLELARQALEDAKDAKSMVRLARDNNGNWSYVYTANQDDVDKAEQDYEDAIREMEQANEDYIKNIQDQIVQVQQEAQQAILALQPEDFATYDDYLAAVQNIQNSMYQTLDYLKSQMNNAFGNNQWLENYVPNIIQDHGLTDDFGNTILSDLLANDNLNSIIQNAKNNFENNLIAPALEAFTLYSEKQKEVYIAANKDIATIGQSFGEEMDQLTEKSEDQVKVVMDLADRVENSFGSAMEEVTNATAKWLDQIKDIVSNYDTLLTQITALKKIDGEYVEPAKMINGDNAIDSWAEIDRFKRELRDNGILNVITTDTETGKEKATMYIAGTTMVKEFLEEAKTAAAKAEIIDIGDDVDESEDKKVRDYIKQHGLVWIKHKDEELMFSSEEEWDDWYKKHKHVVISDSGGGGDAYSWGTQPFSKSDYDGYNSATGHWQNYDTGGYTGRWQSADTGMYTGEWPGGSIRRNGRLAWVHQKELILKAHDTENFLDAVKIVRQLDNLTNWMANGLGDLIMPKVIGTDNELEQNVHIEAEFPNVTDHNEIEQAFTNLVNMASQYANRK